MRYSRIFGVAAAAIAIVATSAMAELKIGYINSQRIFKEYQGTREAQEKFDKEVAKWEQDASTMKKEIETLKEQIEKQSLLLSSERKKELEDQYKNKLLKYQEFLQQKLGQNGEVLKRNEELTKPIVEKINKIIDKIANEERYDFIFDEANGGVVWGKKAYDLTDKVLKILNSEQ